MSEFDTVLVDTSTLLNLHVPMFARRWDDLGCGAVEALVLFDKIVLDGPSIEVNLAELGWLNDLWDGISIRHLSRAETSRLYLRAATLFNSLNWSSPTLANYLRRWELFGQSGGELSHEEHFHRSLVNWDDVLQYLSDSQSEEVAGAFILPPHIGRPHIGGNHAGKGALQLARHFYYVALQEQVGGALLLHPAKSLFVENKAPRYGYSNRIIDVFDKKVQREYSARRKRWLGDDVQELPLPLLTRFVLVESRRRSWSVGRTIAWLREQPEVQLFRQGMRDLMDHVAAGDKVAISAVLHELEKSSDRFAGNLGTPTRNHSRFSLQVSLPLLQPAFEVPIPLPARSPGQKMLVLIKWILKDS
jgi:hypothetical protein